MQICNLCNLWLRNGKNTYYATYFHNIIHRTEAKMERECCALEMHATYEAEINQAYSKDYQGFCA